MVDRWLWEMAEAGLIVRYTVNEKHLIEVCRWGDFQHPQKPKPSTFPPAHSASTRRVRDEYGTTPALFPYGGDGMGEETDTEKEGESEGEPKQTLHNSQPVDNRRLPTPLRERLVQLEANPPVRLTSVEGAWMDPGKAVAVALIFGLLVLTAALSWWVQWNGGWE
jgi:hypothetical protein